MERYEHIITPNQIRTSINFSPKNHGGDNANIPTRNRAEHAARLQMLFDVARSENERIKNEMRAVALPARTGTYLEFSGASAHELATKSLEDQKAGIRLLNIRTVVSEDNEEQTFATVYIPYGEERRFLNKLNKYATEDTPKGKPKNDNLFRSIERVNIALLKALWTDNINEFPSERLDWYEVWIRTNDFDTLENQHRRFINTLETLQIEYKHDSILTFPERSVFLVNANIESLTNILQGSDQLAEIRTVRTLTGLIFDEYRNEQQEWVNDIHDRLIINDETESVVCVLDTGVNNGHPLLVNIIDDFHCASVVGDGNADQHGHGTAMCGTVIYGDLSKHLASIHPISINHKVSSVKLLPYNAVNPKENWGHLTVQAVASADVMSPNTNICYCMAITAEECEQGKPSSWSGAIDSIAYNSGTNGKLFLISAGNIIDNDAITKQYPKGNSLCKIQNPAQSWNCMTIGAYTDIIATNSPHLQGYDRVAPKGGISPFSRTSVLWGKASLIKPEVMFEGGNLYKTNNPILPFSTDSDLQLITTNSNYIF